MPPDISVIICTHTEERWELLVAAINSVQNQVVPPRETIIIVDHNPILKKRVETHFPGIVTIENYGIPGLADSRNQGINICKSELIAFLDDDAIAEPDWLKYLLQGYLHENVMGVGGQIQPVWLAKRPTWFPEEFNWIVGCTYKGMPTYTKEVRNLIGANMSFQKEAVQAVNGFFNGIGHHESTPLGGSDPEFCIRLRQKFPGKVLLFYPKALVHHQVPPVRSTWKYFCIRCYYEGRSKAILTNRLGISDSLSTERSYVKSTLPRAVIQDLRDSLTSHNLSKLGEAGAIIIGLGITSFGYITGIVSQYSGRKKSKG